MICFVIILFCLNSGIFGLRATLNALMPHNAELAYELVTQTSYPSYGFMLDHGATTMWEIWGAKVGDSMNSHDHPSE